MPTKKKYNARFPPARIKKIMQTDEDIGKVAAPVPVILCITTESQFDFLKELVENIPDLPANEEDVDDLDDQPKPKRKKTSTSTVTQKEKAPRRGRKKKEKETLSESDEDSHSEEEDGSNSTGSGNAHSDVSSSCPSFPPSTLMDQNAHVPSKTLQSSSSLPTSLQIPPNSSSSMSIPSLYRPVHSEDDDYDS